MFTSRQCGLLRTVICTTLPYARPPILFLFYRTSYLLLSLFMPPWRMHAPIASAYERLPAHQHDAASSTASPATARSTNLHVGWQQLVNTSSATTPARFLQVQQQQPTTAAKCRSVHQRSALPNSCLLLLGSTCTLPKHQTFTVVVHLNVHHRSLHKITQHTVPYTSRSGLGGQTQHAFVASTTPRHVPPALDRFSYPSKPHPYHVVYTSGCTS